MKLASSGHLYADLKDENACLNIICWRSTVSRLKIKPEDGLDVVCTGKITTYPKSSRYQLIVDSIELAGEGALLKMLEDRKKKLAAEGLFAPERKNSSGVEFGHAAALAALRDDIAKAPGRVDAAPLVNGKVARGIRREVLSPIDGKPVGSVEECDEAAVGQIMTAAGAGFPSWSATRVETRAAALSL